MTVSKMIQKSDSLYQKSTNSFQKFYSLFALTNAYQRNNQMNHAYKTIVKADSIAKVSGLNIELVKSKIYLADFSRNVKDFELMDKYLEEAEKVINKESKHPEYYKIKASLINQRGTYYLSKQDNEKALEVFDRGYQMMKSDQNFKTKDIEFVLLENIYKTLMTYLQMEKYDLASRKLEEGIQLNDKLKNKIYTSVFKSLESWIALKKGEKKRAAEIISEKLEKDTLMGLQKHIKTNLMIMSSIGNDEDDISIKNVDTKYKDYLEHDMSETLQLSHSIKKEEEKRFLESVERTKIYYFGLSGIVLLVLLGLFYVYNKRQNERVREKFTLVINQLKDNENTFSNDKLKDEVKLPFELSKENVNKLLEQLKLFESEHKYIYPKITLGSMADEMKTNTKYLSYILKNYRDSNFPDYINKKRIEYITNRLYNEPSLLKYKIEHIAEMTGYSSHSRFTQVFKAQNNISPSDFIRQLKKDLE